MAPRILIADDDRAIRDALERAIGLEGYEVELVNDGVAALEAVARSSPDLLILDVMMPSLDGLGVCRALRNQGDRTPILILTARTEVSDRVSGLDAGADDYLPKPFALDELLARMRALLRRTTTESGSEAQNLIAADVLIEESSRRAWRGERELELTKTEFDLLALLVRNAGIVLSHTTIYEDIWGYDFGPDSKSLAVYVGYLRRKTEADGEARLVQTVRGIGYTLREQR
ncbi:two component transcriptional regulator, winged helix family [Actinobacteria bacterium IMCC26256]|nr:two component transcriptional regulator, winged helix family [Actinobacteria bacterium IMCC26256]